MHSIANRMGPLLLYNKKAPEKETHTHTRIHSTVQLFAMHNALGNKRPSDLYVFKSMHLLVIVLFDECCLPKCHSAHNFQQPSSMCYYKSFLNRFKYYYYMLWIKWEWYQITRMPTFLPFDVSCSRERIFNRGDYHTTSLKFRQIRKLEMHSLRWTSM